MDIQGYFTKKGLALSAKLSAGSTLTITRVEAGSGQTADPMSATSLPQIQQWLEIKNVTCHENTATLSAVLVAGDAKADYTLTELGVYAQDPDEGEILYKLYQLSAPVDIVAGSRMVLRFYLEETVSQDVDVRPVLSVAGHTFDTDFVPVRDVVMMNQVDEEIVHLTAEQLVPYLKSLPRLVTSSKKIYVSGGTIEETLELNGFYGPGRLWIEVASGAELVLTDGASVVFCSIQVLMIGVKLSGEVQKGSYVELYSSPNVCMINCSIDGTGTSGKYGVDCSNGSGVSLNNCSIQNTDSGVYACGCSVVALENCTGSGNTYGSHVYAGGIILLCGSTSELFGGVSNKKNGGIIAKASGELI